MAQILIASQPFAGHVFPLLPIATELVRRGHQVRWYTGRKYAGNIRASGAQVEPFVHARDFDDANFDAVFPGRDRLSRLRRLQLDVRQIFIGQLEAQLHDLEQINSTWPADVVLAEQTLSSPLLLNELGGPPCALLGILPLGIVSRDTAPFGLGLLPDVSPLGQLRHRALHWAAQNVIFGAASQDLRALCRKLGLQQRNFTLPRSPHLMLQATDATFEYPQRDLPRQLHFIGPLTPPNPVGASLPAWWPELQTERRPVVLVTQGTVATNPCDLLWPSIQALAGEDILLVVAGATEKELSTLGGIPANVRIAAFVPFELLLPYVQVYVSNGGYGGVQQALAHGLPVVVAGDSEDKAEVANRVHFAGVGLNLRTGHPTSSQVGAAIKTLLRDGVVRRRARVMGEAMRRHDAPVEASNLMERLVQTGTVVYREDTPG